MKEHARLLLEKADHALRAARILEESDEIEFAAGRLYYATSYVAEGEGTTSPGGGRPVAGGVGQSETVM